MVDFSAFSLPIIFILFTAAAVVIALVGTRLTKVADLLADKTGLGEAIVGAVMLGAATSLSGIVTSVTAAAGGAAELAISNALGGVAAQTVFLAVADMSYRNINLEHAAASIANLMQGTLLATLLAIPIMALAGPDVSYFGIHPASIILILAYGFGIYLIAQAEEDPMWDPYRTPETKEDDPDESEEEAKQTSLTRLWMSFFALSLLLGVAGFVVARTGVQIAEQTGISATIVGGLLTAIATSLPELVTTIAAVRRGALTLAVGGVIGGNAFDTLFVAFSDFAYRDGSIYHAITNQQVFIIALTILMTGILLLGLLRREKQGIGNIGFESFLTLALYFGSFALLYFTG